MRVAVVHVIHGPPCTRRVPVAEVMNVYDGGLCAKQVAASSFIFSILLSFHSGEWKNVLADCEMTGELGCGAHENNNILCLFLYTHCISVWFCFWP